MSGSHLGGQTDPGRPVPMPNPSVVLHLNQLNKEVVKLHDDVAIIENRIVQIEKFLGVDFSVDKPEKNIEGLVFTAPAV